MKYLSLDLETTSLQPDSDHILQISGVVEDTTTKLPVRDLPHFTAFIKHPNIVGEAYALAMNAWILDIISGRNKDYFKTLPYPILGDYMYSQDEDPKCPYWVPKFNEFLNQHFGSEKITVAGKNVAGFDIPFLPKTVSKRFRHKVLDPGSLFVNWAEDDQVPNFERCKQRAGLEGPVAHDAREDAMDVILLLRKFY